MDLMVLGLIVLVFYLLVRLVATSSSWLTGRRFQAYRQLAALFRGKYESRGLTDPPTVSFTHNGSAVRVGLAPQVQGQSQPARTRVVARFNGGLPFRMELAPTARQAPAQAPKGTRLVRIGDPEFDRGYVVQANDPEMAREFLVPSVRRAIRNLHRLAPPAGMLVSINPERLLVQVDRNLGLHSEVLAGMVGESLMIHDGLKQGVTARMGQGIDIVDAGPSEVEDAGPPVCKVCGDPILQSRVLCASCRTPHHQDCWEFIGACSIYGCSGKKSVPA
jgi:hypothetical protein